MFLHNAVLTYGKQPIWQTSFVFIMELSQKLTKGKYASLDFAEGASLCRTYEMKLPGTPRLD